MFISVCGLDGAGKGVLMENIKKHLDSKGVNYILTREPGGTVVAEKIREVIVNEDIDDITEALLFASARRDHVEKKIKPALKEGKLVISDRFIDSSLAYQGVGRGLGIDFVKHINEIAIGDFMPDKTIYLDLDPEIGLQRIKENNREENRLDKEKIDFYKKNREGYLELARRYPNRYIVLNAEKSPEEVFSELLSKFKFE